MGKKIRFDELFVVGSAKRVLKSQWKKEGVPFYRGREVTKLSINGSVNNQLFISKEHYKELKNKHGVPNVGDIIITAIGTIGNAYIVKENDEFYFKDASVLWLKKKSNIISKYVSYFIKSDIFKSQLDNGNGATVDTLTIKKLASIEIEVPILSEQQRIVAKLDAVIAEINKSIEATKLSIKNLNKYIGKVTDFLIHNNLENYKNFTLDDITDTITCGVAKRPEYEDKGIIFLSARNVKNGKMKWVNYKFISEQAHKILTKNSKPEIGDILYSRVGAGFGDAAIIDKDVELSIFVSLTLIKVKPIVLNEYLYYYLNSPIIKELARKNITGTSVGNLNVGAVKLFKIKLPNLNNQKLIIDKLKLLKTHGESIINIYNKKMNNYILLKNSIISSLLSYKKAKVA